MKLVTMKLSQPVLSRSKQNTKSCPKNKPTQNYSYDKAEKHKRKTRVAGSCNQPVKTMKKKLVFTSKNRKR
jgi:hypothetical protein